MRTIRSPRSMQREALRWRAAGRSVALVPTMGYLHEGHLSLVRRARELADLLVVSVFVNPTQFVPGEDLERYPRDARRDARLLRDERVDVLFLPERDRIYATDHSTWVVEEDLASGLCGAFRPGHFRGVTTVVAKLFNLVQPTVAVFGAKDYQQAMVIRRMVRDLDFPVRIVTAPTVREPDGLAMSSRNAYLDPDRRSEARALNRALQTVRRMLDAGERNAGALRDRLRAAIRDEAPDAEIEYAEIVDAETLRPVRQVVGPTAAAVAVRLGGTRLIDNVVWRPRG